MKLNFGRRVLLFVHWLVSLIVVASLVFSDFTAQQVSLLEGLIGANYVQILLIVLLVLYLLLSAAVVCLIFRRGPGRSDRGFITVDASDTGKVRIAVSAIEQMVRQAAHTVDGISEMKISIESLDDAIAIQVNMTMVSGSHVPTVTLNLQRAIRQFVEMNCGVGVRSVSININAVSNTGESGKRSDSRRGEAKRAEPVQPASSQVTPVQTPVESTFTATAPVADPFAQEEPAAEEPATAAEDPEKVDSEGFTLSNEEQ